MLYKNSLKILFSNFKNVWKSLLYFLGIFIFTIVFMYLAIRPIYDLLIDAGFIQGILDVYASFLKSLNLEELLLSIKRLGGEFLQILTENMGVIWINFLAMFLTIFLFNIFMSNLSVMANCNCLNYYMGSMNEQGFYLSFKETLGKNLKVTLAHYIVSLPIKIIIVGLFVLSLKLFSVEWLWSMASVFIIICMLVLMLAFNTTLYSAWIPTMVILNFGVWKSLKLAFKMIFKRFGRIFGCAVGVVLTMIAVNMFLGLFTFGVGLLVSVPASYMLYSAFGMIIAFEGQGMRYYVDIYNVITPRKKENSDKLIEMKYIV